MSGCLPFSSSFVPIRLQALGPCGQGSFEASTEQLSKLPVAAQNPWASWGQGGMKGNPQTPFPVISGDEDIRTASCGYTERGGVREKNSIDFFSFKFYFPYHFEYFLKKKTVKIGK